MGDVVVEEVWVRDQCRAHNSQKEYADYFKYLIIIAVA
jgi:hypothetical protein